MTPHIIRTVQELEALDPDTMLMNTANMAAWNKLQIYEEELPVAVIANGGQVRQARKALEES